MTMKHRFMSLCDFFAKLLPFRARNVPAKEPLPQEAAAIYVEWAIQEGGFQAAAWTDKAGTPYIAIKTLNRIGKTTGLYDWHRSDLFITDMVAGFIDGRPLIVRLHVKVTAKGLTMIVRLPSGSKLKFEDKRFAPWGSGEPAVSVTLAPTFDHYAVQSFPTLNE